MRTDWMKRVAKKTKESGTMRTNHTIKVASGAEEEDSNVNKSDETRGGRRRRRQSGNSGQRPSPSHVSHFNCGIEMPSQSKKSSQWQLS